MNRLRTNSFIAFLVTFFASSQTDLILAQELTLEPTQALYDKAGGGGAVSVNSPAAWNATTEASWITLFTSSGDAGAGRVLYSVSSNMTADSRETVIKIGNQDFKVVQSGYVGTISPTQSSYDKNGGSGTISVTVDAGIKWGATTPVDWISVPGIVKMSSGSIDYEVSPYSGIATRSATITVAGQVLTVTQTGRDVAVSPELVERDYKANLIILEVNAFQNTAWLVSPSVAWIDVLDKGAGAGTSNVVLSISENPSFIEREGTVRIGSAIVKVIQEGTTNLNFGVSPTDTTAPPEGATGIVNINATPDAPWSASSTAPWVIIDKGRTGAGSGEIKYVVSANTSTDTRVGKIVVSPPKVDTGGNLGVGMIGAWPGVFDLSGYEHHLTGGNFGMTFDGTFKRTLTSIEAAPQFNWLNQQATMSFWFQADLKDDQSKILKIKDNNLFVNQQNQVKLSVNGRQLLLAEEIDPTQFHLIIFSQDRKTLTTSVRSLDSDTNLVTVHNLEGDESLLGDNLVPSQIELGYNSAPTAGFFDGTLRDIRLWNRLLSEQETDLVYDNRILEVFNRYELKGYAIYSAKPADANFAPQLSWEYASLAKTGYFGDWGWSDIELDGNRWRSRQTGITHSGQWHAGQPSGGDIQTILSNGEVHDTYRSGHRAAHIKVNDPSADLLKRYGHPKDSNDDLKVFEFIGNGFADGGMLNLFGQSPKAYGNISDRHGNPQQAMSLSARDTIRIQPDNDRFIAGTNEITFAAWLKVDKFEKLNAFTIRNVPSVVSLGFDTAEQGFVNGLKFNHNIQLNEWFHMALVCVDGVRTRLFLNGLEVLDTTELKSFSFSQSNNDYRWIDIGPFWGGIDRLEVRRGAMNPSQVVELYRSQSDQDMVVTITQPPSEGGFIPDKVSMAAGGGVLEVNYNIAAGTFWEISQKPSWITIADNQSSGVGAKTLTLTVADNGSVDSRSGQISIGNATLEISQSGQYVYMDLPSKVFGTTSGLGTVNVLADGNAAWVATADVDWIDITEGQSEDGAGIISYIVSQYASTTEARTGIITVGSAQHVVTQRGYALTVSPNGIEVGSDATEGSIDVAADLGAVWEAVSTTSWITLYGSQTGTGAGTVTYRLAENDTGVIRSGRIVIAGEVIKVTQTAQPSSGGSGGNSNDRHPADQSEPFMSMSISEVTGYGAAWKKGNEWPVGPNPIPIGYLTRAGLLWKSGEAYTRAAGVELPLAWQSTTQAPAMGRADGRRVDASMDASGNLIIDSEISVDCLAFEIWDPISGSTNQRFGPYLAAGESTNPVSVRLNDFDFGSTYILRVSCDGINSLHIYRSGGTHLIQDGDLVAFSEQEKLYLVGEWGPEASYELRQARLPSSHQWEPVTTSSPVPWQVLSPDSGGLNMFYALFPHQSLQLSR